MSVPQFAWATTLSRAGLLDDDTIARAARTFKQFRDRMDRYQVSAYRAVATAAARESRNYRKLMDRIRRKSGLELEVIGNEEEARLVCSAVKWALSDRLQPRLDFRSRWRQPGTKFFSARRARASHWTSARHHTSDGNVFH